MNRKFLCIYLQDHLAGSTGGLELARRARGANEGTPYGEPLAKPADDIEADRRALERVTSWAAVRRSAGCGLRAR